MFELLAREVSDDRQLLAKLAPRSLNADLLHAGGAVGRNAAIVADLAIAAGRGFMLSPSCRVVLRRRAAYARARVRQRRLHMIRSVSRASEIVAAAALVSAFGAEIFFEQSGIGVPSISSGVGKSGMARSFEVLLAMLVVFSTQLTAHWLMARSRRNAPTVGGNISSGDIRTWNGTALDATDSMWRTHFVFMLFVSVHVINLSIESAGWFHFCHSFAMPDERRCV